MELGPGCFSTKTRVFFSPGTSIPFSVALKYVSQASGVKKRTTAKLEPDSGSVMDSSLPPQTRACRAWIDEKPATPFRMQAL
jgi:hypothetical protein